MTKKVNSPVIVQDEISERYSFLSKLTQDVIWDWNLVDGRIWWSDTLADVYGYPNDINSSKPDFWYNCIHPEDVIRVREKLQTELSKGLTNWADQYKLVKSDGTAMDVSNKGYIIYKEQVPVRMVGAIQYVSTTGGSHQSNLSKIEKLQFAVSSAEIGIWELDPLTNHISWDKKCAELFGYESDEHVDYENSLERVHPDDRERINEAIQNVLKPDSGGLYEAQFRTVDGEGRLWKWIQCRGRVTFNDKAIAVGFIGIAQDITTQVNNLEKILLADNQASLAIDSAAAGSFLVNLDKQDFTFSPALSKILTGEENASLSREGIISHLHGDDHQIRNGAFKTAQETGELSYEARYIWNDKSVHWIRVNGKYLYDRTGKPVKLSGIVQDITDQVNYQARLKSNEEYLQNMINNSPIAIALLRVPDLVVESANNTFLKLVNISGKLTGEKISLKETEHPFLNASQQALNSGETTYIKEMHFGISCGNTTRNVFYDITISPVKNDVGQVSCLIATGNEVTAQVKARADLEASESRFRTLIEEAPVATTLLIGPDLIIEHPNEEMLALWNVADVHGKPLREVTLQPGILETLNEVYISGKTLQLKASPVQLTKNGEPGTFYFDITYKPLQNTDGQTYAILEMAVDVTSQINAIQELQKSEERYRQLANDLDLRVQERTNELRKINQELVNSNSNLQQFAYAASHDLQEPLRKIQSFGSRLKNSYSADLDGTATYILDRMQDASKRMSAMIDDLLAYSRLSTQDNEFSPISLESVIKQVVTDLEIAINEANATITFDKLPVLLGNERQLLQLFLNILGNALKYSKKGIPAQIQILNRSVETTELEGISGLLPDYQYTCIEVTDNGIGFSIEYLDRIFQMFQRLHGRSEYSGSGIGLALCKKVVQNHHGYITARSEPNVGSTFMIYLPVA